MNDFFYVTNNIDIVIKCIIIIFTQITCYKIINDNKYITISKCVWLCYINYFVNFDEIYRV